MIEFCGLALSHRVINGSGTFDAIAAISGRSSHAATSEASSSPVDPITLVINGTGSVASCGRSSAR